MSQELLRSVRLRLRDLSRRDRLFPSGMFYEPVWPMLLHCLEAELLERPISVSGLVELSPVPATSALRVVHRMLAQGWLARKNDPADRRRSWITLTEKSRDTLTAVLRPIGAGQSSEVPDWSAEVRLVVEAGEMADRLRSIAARLDELRGGD